ncbi:MAG: hypothetical protein ACRDDY_09615 [Clostridium sp.]|uniref:hypothetical protein n=1 Tax=Clostridium sp. TaxID=1506 RepID=UPI003EE70265
MSFRLKFNFKIHNKTNNHLKDIEILDDEGILHQNTSETLNENENLDLQEVYMHLYKPEHIYLRFIDKHNIEQKLVLFKDIKKQLKLTYDIFISKEKNQNYTIQVN